MDEKEREINHQRNLFFYTKVDELFNSGTLAELGPHTALVYIAAIRAANMQTGRWSIRIAGIAKETGISRKWVEHSLKKLIKIEYIKKESEYVYVLEHVTKKRPPASFNPISPMTRKLEELWGK